MKNYMSLALVALAFLLSPDLNSQSIILVNGEPTEVILDGDAIKSIVKNKIEDYMKEYGQEVDKEFEQSDLRFESRRNQSQPSTETSSDTTELMTQDIVLSADRPQELDKFK